MDNHRFVFYHSIFLELLNYFRLSQSLLGIAVTVPYFYRPDALPVAEAAASKN